MIGTICAEIKNFFTYEEDRHLDDWTIENGVLTPFLDIPTDYIRIVGSRRNDGVHKRKQDGTFDLTDESFHGAVWVMSPPADFLALVAEITEWQAKYGGVGSENMSPYQSESFGGYSYSKSSGRTSENSVSSVPTWQALYSSRLKQYRRIRTL